MLSIRGGQMRLHLIPQGPEGWFGQNVWYHQKAIPPSRRS